MFIHRKLIKSNKLKVQVSMQGESLRVSGKKRDDLQTVIEIVKKIIQIYETF